LLVHGMVIEVVVRWSGSRQAKRSLRWPWQQGRNRIRIRKTWGPKPEFHQTAYFSCREMNRFTVRRTVAEGVGKWSGFLMERATISVVGRDRRKSLSGRGHDLRPKAASAAEGWREGCHGSAVRDGGPTRPVGVSALVGREGRQVDGLEGNFEVMDPGIPSNGN
jgi:hypothetical protein